LKFGILWCLEVFREIIIASAYVLCRFEWDCPIVLIGHSFGGLVLKSLVVEAKKISIRYAEDDLSRAAGDHAKAFLNNVRGVVFYAVPHGGSYNIAKYVNNLLRCNDTHHALIMEDVQPWRRNMEELSEEFENFLKEKKVNVYAFGEGKPMNVVCICYKKCPFFYQISLRFTCLICCVRFQFGRGSREFWFILLWHND
jgi:hypothetical protein